MGQIFHADLEYTQSGQEVVDLFTSIIEITDTKAILEIKISNFQGNNVVLAIIESSLYQF